VRRPFLFLLDWIEKSCGIGDLPGVLDFYCVVALLLFFAGVAEVAPCNRPDCKVAAFAGAFVDWSKPSLAAPILLDLADVAFAFVDV
jgi:hypothetical protein